MSETPSRSGEEFARKSERVDRGMGRVAGGGPGGEPGEERGREPGREAPRETDRAMTVLVNGAALEWPETGTVADLLARLGMQGKRVAVSIDRSVIPRSRHGEALVRAGDRIEILEAVGGG